MIQPKALSESIVHSARTQTLVHGVSGPLEQAAGELLGYQKRLEDTRGQLSTVEAKLKLQEEEEAAARVALSSELKSVRAEAEAAVARSAAELEGVRGVAAAEREGLTAEISAAKAEALRACEWAERMAAEVAAMQSRCSLIQVFLMPRMEREPATTSNHLHVVNLLKALGSRNLIGRMGEPGMNLVTDPPQGDADAAREDAALARLQAHDSRQQAARLSADLDAARRSSTDTTKHRRTEQAALIEQATMMVSQLRSGGASITNIS